MASTGAVTFGIDRLAEINSAEEFVQAVFALRSSNAVSNEKLWYRGLSDHTYTLTPMVGRPLPYAGRRPTLDADGERNLLARFRKRSYPHVERTMKAGEAIFLARHHGLPTRLLDWSANPLFGLYFACHDQSAIDKDAKVWAMLLRRESDRKDLDAFDLASRESETELFGYPFSSAPPDASDQYALKMVYPILNSPRLLAQDGAFTLHFNPRIAIEDLKGKPFTSENLDIERLYWWPIPSASKVRIIEGLSGLGITHRLLFPDLDGVARSIWETQVLWRG